MPVNRLLQCSIVAIFLSGCCTKVECDIALSPIVGITFENYTNAELAEGKAFIYGEKSKAVIDSFSLEHKRLLDLYTNTHGNNSYFRIDTVRLVFQLAGRTDVLEDISYEAYSDKISCNKCFLKDGRKTVTRYNTKSFTYNNEVHKNEAVLTIRK